MVNETNWTYIRIRKSTAKKLQILKAELESDMYDDVVDLLLSNHRLVSPTSEPHNKQKVHAHQEGGKSKWTLNSLYKGCLAEDILTYQKPNSSQTRGFVPFSILI